MRAFALVLLLISAVSALELKTGLLYTGWPESDSALNGIIEITADTAASSERLPVQVIYLIDISRESAGNVRQGLIEGGKKLITSLRDGDRFGMVVYSKFSRTLLPLTNLTPEVRKSSVEMLERITTEEGRDLSGALSRAQSEFKLRAGEKIEGRYLVLSSLGPITDGKRGDELLREMAITAGDTSYTLYTVGYGDAFSEDLMIKSAEMSGGRAYYARKENADTLDSIFTDIGRTITAPMYRDLELFADIPEGGVRFCRFGTDSLFANPIKIKQICRGKTERILFTLNRRPEKTTTIDFDLSFYDVKARTSGTMKSTAKLTLLKEQVYSSSAGTVIQASVLKNLAENSAVFRRAEKEKDAKGAREFRREYAFKFQQQVVNRIESLQSSVKSPEMEKNAALMKLLFEEIRDGVYGTEHIVRVIKYDLHQTLYGR